MILDIVADDWNCGDVTRDFHAETLGLRTMVSDGGFTWFSPVDDGYIMVT